MALTLKHMQTLKIAIENGVAKYQEENREFHIANNRSYVLIANTNRYLTKMLH